MRKKSSRNITRKSDERVAAEQAPQSGKPPRKMARSVEGQGVKLRLTNGLHVLVDLMDVEWLSKYRWGHNSFVNNNGYARRWGTDEFGRKTNILMHREITGCPLGMQVDHINHDTLDNRRSNLRIVTKHQNMANARKTALPRSSKYKGVYWYRQSNKWGAQIMRNRVYQHLGYFKTEDEAAAAYNRKATELSPEYSALNSIP